MGEKLPDLQSFAEHETPPNTTDYTLLQIGVEPSTDPFEYAGQVYRHLPELIEAYPRPGDMDQEARDTMSRLYVDYVFDHSEVYKNKWSEEDVENVEGEEDLPLLGFTTSDDIRAVGGDQTNLETRPAFDSQTTGTTGRPKHASGSLKDRLNHVLEYAAQQKDILEIDDVRGTNGVGVNFYPAKTHLIGTAHDWVNEALGIQTVHDHFMGRAPHEYLEDIIQAEDEYGDILYIGAAPSTPGPEPAPTTHKALLKADLENDMGVYEEVLEGAVVQGGGSPWEVDLVADIHSLGPEKIVNGYGTCEIGGTYSWDDSLMNDLETLEKRRSEEGEIKFVSGIQIPSRWSVEHRDDEDLPGDWGELVVTTLGNERTPLVNYNIGDVARKVGEHRFEDIVRRGWMEYDEDGGTMTFEIPSHAGTCVADV